MSLISLKGRTEEEVSRQCLHSLLALVPDLPLPAIPPSSQDGHLASSGQGQHYSDSSLVALSAMVSGVKMDGIGCAPLLRISYVLTQNRAQILHLHLLALRLVMWRISLLY